MPSRRRWPRRAAETGPGPSLICAKTDHRLGEPPTSRATGFPCTVKPWGNEEIAANPALNPRMDVLRRFEITGRHSSGLGTWRDKGVRACGKQEVGSSSRFCKPTKARIPRPLAAGVGSGGIGGRILPAGFRRSLRECLCRTDGRKPRGKGRWPTRAIVRRRPLEWAIGLPSIGPSLLGRGRRISRPRTAPCARISADAAAGTRPPAIMCISASRPNSACRRFLNGNRLPRGCSFPTPATFLTFLRPMPPQRTCAWRRWMRLRALLFVYTPRNSIGTRRGMARLHQPIEHLCLSLRPHFPHMDLWRALRCCVETAAAWGRGDRKTGMGPHVFDFHAPSRVRATRLATAGPGSRRSGAAAYVADRVSDGPPEAHR